MKRVAPGPERGRSHRRRRAAAAILGLFLVAGGCADTGPGPGRPVVDLVATLDEAEVRRETRLVDLGSEAARWHLVSGFDERQQPVEVLRSRGRSVTTRVRVAVARPTTLRLRARARVAADTPLEVMLEGMPVGEVTLEDRFGVQELAVPERFWREGINRLRFRVAEGANSPEVIDWDWLRLDHDAEFPEAVPEVRRDASREPTLWIPYGTTVEFPARLPEDGGRLQLDGVAASGTAGRLRVRVLADGADGPRVLAETRLAIDHQDDAHDLPLPGSGDGIVRIELRALPGAPGSEPGVAAGAVLLRTARVVAPRPASAAGAGTPPVPSAPPNIIVFLVDTLRADRLGAYGYERPTSPEIDAFAAGRAALFERATAHSSWTKPTVASVFTGVHPPSHGVIEHDRVLADANETMAELLSAAGYETAGFVTITTVAAMFGFGQGFDRYEEMLEDGSLPGLHQPAGRVVDAALDWIDRRPDPGRPLFLYVHVSDPHAPYVPPDAWRDRFAPGQRGIDPASFGGLEGAELEARVAAASDLYDAEVAYVDEQFGRFVDELDARGILEDAALVFLSDHGEEFLEHGGWAHGRTLHRELVDVPVILKLPDGLGAGRRVGGRVRQVDVLPTVLQLAGIAEPDGLQGDSLLPLLVADGPSRPVHGHLRVRGRHQDSLVEAGWKLVTTEQPGDQRLLFHLETDPEESVDVDRSRPITVHYLGARLRSLAAGFAAAGIDAGQATLSPEVEARLRALGYIR